MAKGQLRNGLTPTLNQLLRANQKALLRFDQMSRDTQALIDELNNEELLTIESLVSVFLDIAFQKMNGEFTDILEDHFR